MVARHKNGNHQKRSDNRKGRSDKTVRNRAKSPQRRRSKSRPRRPAPQSDNGGTTRGSSPVRQGKIRSKQPYEDQRHRKSIVKVSSRGQREERRDGTPIRRQEFNEGRRDGGQERKTSQRISKRASKSCTNISRRTPKALPANATQRYNAKRPGHNMRDRSPRRRPTRETPDDVVNRETQRGCRRRSVSPSKRNRRSISPSKRIGERRSVSPTRHREEPNVSKRTPDRNSRRIDTSFKKDARIQMPPKIIGVTKYKEEKTLQEASTSETSIPHQLALLLFKRVLHPQECIGSGSRRSMPSANSKMAGKAGDESVMHAPSSRVGCWTCTPPERAASEVEESPSGMDYTYTYCTESGQESGLPHSPEPQRGELEKHHDATINDFISYSKDHTESIHEGAIEFAEQGEEVSLGQYEHEHLGQYERDVAAVASF